MSLAPLGAHVLCRPEPLPRASSVVQLVTPQEPPGREATVLCSGDTEFQVGDRIVVSMRLAIQVGENLLVPTTGILARLHPV